MIVERTEDVSAQIEEVCRVVRIVEVGGGQFVGFQPGPHGYLVLFRDPFVHTTLAAPICELTADQVREKIAGAIQTREENTASVIS